MSDTAYRYLYLHGFGSSRDSYKGRILHERLGGGGVEIELPDLNVPSFESQTYSCILEHLDRLDAARSERTTTLRIIGSSLGGYLAARWAELRPARVDRLVLLCPGFDLPSRWPGLVGEQALRRWEREGTLIVDHGDHGPRPLRWSFVRDAERHPRFPEVSCPTRILHGTADDVVPVELSREYARTRPRVTLVELDDGHTLTDSIDRIEDEVRAHFGIGS